MYPFARSSVGLMADCNRRLKPERGHGRGSKAGQRRTFVLHHRPRRDSAPDNVRSGCRQTSVAAQKSGAGDDDVGPALDLAVDALKLN